MEKEPSGLRGQCPQAGLWLLTCHITNIIIFRAAGGKIWAWRLKNVAKVGVACPPYPQKLNISPRCCLNALRFLVFDSETADEHCNATTEWNSKISTDISRNFCKAVRDNARSPHLTTDTQLRVTKITYLYDPDPTFHSIN